MSADVLSVNTSMNVDFLIAIAILLLPYLAKQNKLVMPSLHV